MKRLVTGLKPTGELTLGNYIGAIKQVVNYQNEYDTYLFVSDLHSLTVDDDPQMIHKNIRDFIVLYIACGVDPSKVNMYIQSECPYITAVAWMLECNSYFGEMSRMIQFKEKTKNKENFTVGLFTYPVLMASDILVIDADIVPVGIDQKQHVELARDIAIRFNNKYDNTFVVPEPKITVVGTKIMDLQDPTKKMSKTSENKKGVIDLLDNPEDARKKIMGATTDSETIVRYDPVNKPGISNLMNIYSGITDVSIEEIEIKFRNHNYGEFKKEVANVVVRFLSDIQEIYNKLIEKEEIDFMLDRNSKIVNELAKKKYEAIRLKTGVYR